MSVPSVQLGTMLQTKNVYLNKKKPSKKILQEIINLKKKDIYVGNSISKLQIQVTTYVFELSAGNCHR